MFDMRAYQKERQSKHPEYRRASYHRRRDEVFRMYGDKCACCGASERVFLALDHMAGGGSEFRRKNGTHAVYALAVKEHRPDLFQILCHNCNWAKSHGGCPHKVKRD